MHAQYNRCASPLAQDYSVIYKTDDNTRYVEGSGLVRLGDDFIAVVPVIPRTGTDRDAERRVEESATHILRSKDGGETWQQIAELPRLYSAVPWTHNGNLYLFAMKGGLEFRNDDLLLLRSTDDGRTWTEPVTLFKGHFWNCHTGMVIDGNRLYWAVDDLSFGMANRGPRALAGDLSGDVLDPKSWRMSEAVPFPGVPEKMTHPALHEEFSQYLEPNVISVNGRLRVLVTVKLKLMSTTGLCSILDLKDDGRNLKLSFTQYHPMPGGQLKFGVVWDERSQMFWRTANLPVDGQNLFGWWQKGSERGVFRPAAGGNDRRFLMLFYSLDGMNWLQAGCIARAGKISQSFMYSLPVIDGEDLAIIVRTSSPDAPNQHDSDSATFHRVKDFRSLALDLFPLPEER